MGKGVFHRISLWKHIGVLRMQYRADDESRCHPVKREGPPVSSASSSSGRAAKRQKMLEMVEATDDDLLSTLSHEELKKAIRFAMVKRDDFCRLGHFFFVWWGDVAKIFEVHVQFCEKVMNMRWETWSKSMATFHGIDIHRHHPLEGMMT